ncbi:ribosome small subunit-dependent GTPase A [Candidatus Phytoplasma pini]|uniref:Small ribosomal subunit biogenesis GTPase RsgA n=1 Tax=Candidatus Phytoplasma pini TaxID=267362 RepID=A0A559KJ13_9MOLU|nr:ribosome small subunit-dependent GTPase A [Candidatus Phytoplasma pini]TVY12078.1 GTPase EngC [Candidatus Phytoplasma pini]
MHKGIVIEFLVKKYIIVDFETKEKICAQAKGKIKNSFSFLFKKKGDFSDYSKIKIGDIVFYEKKNDTYIIDSIEQRFNTLKRPNITNINQVFLIFSLVQPALNFKLLDKFLLILQQYRLKIVLIFTKIDLVTESQMNFFRQNISYYQQFYSTFYINIKVKKSLNLISSLFRDKITILAGQTGVGKSTLLNNLTSLNLKVQKISKSLNRGKHTTKNSKLYFFYGGYIADTPGFSKLDVYNIPAEKIKDFYLDFLQFSDKCFFGYSCLHIHENNCQVKEALQKKIISHIRYNNYLSLFQTIKEKKSQIFFDKKKI